MIYNYILSTGDATISGCVLSGYSGQKEISSNFQDNYYQIKMMIVREQNLSH